MTSDLALRAVACILAFTGIGFGIPAVIGIRSLAAGNGVPLVLGYPSYGGGPFERIGIPSTVPLVALFLAVCILEILAAALIWQGRRSGGILAMALLLPGIVFWIGFALPIPPVLALVRTVLLAANWSRLS